MGNCPNVCIIHPDKLRSKTDSNYLPNFQIFPVLFGTFAKLRIFAGETNLNVMNKETIAQLIADYFKTQPVVKAWLFGSYSRDEQRVDSDIDILIVPEKGVGLFKLSGMHLDLQNLLKTRVDLVTEKGLMDFARPSVENDKILIYERAA